MATRRLRGAWTLLGTVAMVTAALTLAALQPRWLERAIRSPFQGSEPERVTHTTSPGSRTEGSKIPVIVVSPPRSPAGEDRRGPSSSFPLPARGEAAPNRAPMAPRPVADALGLADPSANRPPTGAVASRLCEWGPGGQGSCSDPCQELLGAGRAPDESAPACVSGWLANIDAARAAEGVAPMVLPSNFDHLEPAEQLLVVVNLERTARGLAPMIGLSSTLDAVAASAVARGEDPSLPQIGGWASIWAGGHASVLGTLYGWMYDDGWGGPGGTTNVACSGPGAPGCWGHRRAILSSFGGCRHCIMGAAWAEDGAGWQPGAWAAIFVPRSDDPGAASLAFTWSSEIGELPACERQGDTC